MSFFRVLGMTVLAGAGAVAAAPALVGGAAATAAVAAGMAAVGLVGAAAASVMDANDRQRNEEEKEEARRAGYADAEKKHKKKFEEILEKLMQNLGFERRLLALFALGVAVANLDGHIGDEEKRELEEFIAGAMSSSLPKAVLDAIRELYNYPPTVDSALEYIKKAEVPLEVVEDLIELIIEADDTMTEEEQEFRAKWAKYKQKYAA